MAMRGAPVTTTGSLAVTLKFNVAAVAGLTSKQGKASSKAA